MIPAMALDFWSVKFYPYTEPGVDPVFAVVGGKRVSSPPAASRGAVAVESNSTKILVCRPPDGKESTKIEVIQMILDEEVTCAYSSGKSIS